MCTVYSITKPINQPASQPTSKTHTHIHNCSQNYANGMKCKWATKITTRKKNESESDLEEEVVGECKQHSCKFARVTNTHTIYVLRYQTD